MNKPAISSPGRIEPMMWKTTTIAKFVVWAVSLWISGALFVLCARSLHSREDPDYVAGNKLVPLVLSLNGVRNKVKISSQVEPSSQGAVNAVHAEKLNELSKEVQIGISDRKTMREDILKFAERDDEHFNTLLNRLDVDEAQVWTTLKTLAVIFGILQGIPALLAVLEFRSKKRKLEE